MSISFSKLGHDVMTERSNYGAPDSMKLKESIPSKDMEGRVITIDEVIVMNKKKYDKKKKEYVKNKNGEQVYQGIAYVAFDGDKFFACKSAILITQLEKFAGKKLIAYDEVDFDVPNIKGTKVKIVTEKIKYKDENMYDNIIFADAE